MVYLQTCMDCEGTPILVGAWARNILVPLHYNRQQSFSDHPRVMRPGSQLLAYVTAFVETNCPKGKKWDIVWWAVQSFASPTSVFCFCKHCTYLHSRKRHYTLKVDIPLEGGLLCLLLCRAGGVSWCRGLGLAPAVHQRSHHNLGADRKTSLTF